MSKILTVTVHEYEAEPLRDYPCGYEPGFDPGPAPTPSLLADMAASVGDDPDPDDTPIEAAGADDRFLVARLKALAFRRVRRRLSGRAVSAAEIDAEIDVVFAHHAKVLGMSDTGRPFLDWLANGGLEKIIELIIRILAVLA